MVGTPELFIREGATWFWSHSWLHSTELPSFGHTIREMILDWQKQKSREVTNRRTSCLCCVVLFRQLMKFLQFPSGHEGYFNSYFCLIHLLVFCKNVLLNQAYSCPPPPTHTHTRNFFSNHWQALYLPSAKPTPLQKVLCADNQLTWLNSLLAFMSFNIFKVRSARRSDSLSSPAHLSVNISRAFGNKTRKGLVVRKQRYFYLAKGQKNVGCIFTISGRWPT